MNLDHEYFVEIHKDGTPLIRVPTPSAEFDRAVTWAHFEGIRHGRLPIATDVPEDPRVTPIWHGSEGAPTVGALAMEIAGPAEGVSGDRPLFTSRIPKEYFRGMAQRATARLVGDGRLEKGDSCEFRILAFPNRSGRPTPPKPAFGVERVPTPLPLREGRLDPLLARTRAEHTPGEDFPVFIPDSVLHEVSRQKQESGALETGGVLIGYLWRDASIPEVFIEVTAQIPANHAEAARTKLTFTADSWAAVRASIELRNRGELWVGWFHTHPAREWCKDCAPERWPHCPLADDFFSAEDANLHRTVFPQGYGIALVAGDRATADRAWRDSFALYGWRAGTIAKRSFRRLPAASVTDDPANGSESEGGPHARCP